MATPAGESVVQQLLQKKKKIVVGLEANFGQSRKKNNLQPQNPNAPQ